MEIQTVKKIVAKYFKYDSSDLDIKTRIREVVFPRQIAHYLCCEFNIGSLSEIGFQIGRKDHATVMHSRKEVKNLLHTNYIFNGVPLKWIIKELEAEIVNRISDKDIVMNRQCFNWQTKKHVSQKTLICNVSNVAPSSRRIKV